MDIEYVNFGRYGMLDQYWIFDWAEGKAIRVIKHDKVFHIKDNHSVTTVINQDIFSFIKERKKTINEVIFS